MKLKLKFNFKIDKNSIALMTGRVKSVFSNLPIAIFIQYGRLLHITVVVVVAVSACILIWQLLYFDPSGVLEVPTAKPKLRVEGIDRLEYWIEVREEEKRTDLSLPGDRFLQEVEI